MLELSPRQIHLDFHTSEYIPDVASSFNAEVFAETISKANVSSVTVFARCHHGWLYYDSKAFPELVHPQLKNRNLLLEEIRALHARGIRAPIYITVQWDYHTASTHPEWLVRMRDGSHEGESFTEPGFYQSLCVNTAYIDFLKAQTREICELLGDELDGIFFDIVGIRPCLCSRCRELMKARGIDLNDDRAVRAFAKESLDRFKLDMTAFVHEIKPDCTLFYNAGHIGVCTKDSAEAYSHFELESLPSGEWGYLHFPVTARYARTLGKDCLGMTGKFHLSWGDFHSLKNPAALEYEVMRILSYGFACSIGDQLEPDGRINPATYRLIGGVYKEYAEREAYMRGSKALVEAAVLTNENPIYEKTMSDNLMGAVQLLEECSVQFDIIDRDMDFSPYKLLIIPDDVPFEPETQKKLDAYVADGGRVLAFCRGGLSSQGSYPKCYGAEYSGMRELYPDFIVPGGELTQGLEDDTEYVIYEQGAVIETKATESLMLAREPYFARVGDHFCSHSYTPSAGAETYTVAAGNGNVILFSHPLMRQYRDNAPRWVKTIIRNALGILLPEQLVKHDGASHLTVQLCEKNNKTYAFVLSYIPVRKSAAIDIIEERTKVYDLALSLKLPKGFSNARLVPEDKELSVEDDKVRLPLVDGFAIVELS